LPRLPAGSSLLFSVLPASCRQMTRTYAEPDTNLYWVMPLPAGCWQHVERALSHFTKA